MGQKLTKTDPLTELIYLTISGWLQPDASPEDVKEAIEACLVWSGSQWSRVIYLTISGWLQPDASPEDVKEAIKACLVWSGSQWSRAALSSASKPGER